MHGTGRKAQLEGVRIAGKTGTAQKADLEKGGYRSDAYTASFVGFFPAEDPRYTALVVVDEPQGEHYGGTVAAPAFRELAQRLLSQPSGKPYGREECEEIDNRWQPYTPPPEPELMLAGLVGPTGVARRLEGAARALHGLRERRALDTGPSPPSSSVDDPSSSISSTRRGTGVVPSLTGLTMREARRELGRAGLRGEWYGTGFVTEQFPASGDTLPPGSVVRVQASLDVAS